MAIEVEHGSAKPACCGTAESTSHFEEDRTTDT